MRDLNASTGDALAGRQLCPVLLVELEFGSGALRLWTGAGDLVWDERGTFTGSGGLLAVGEIEEAIDLRAPGVSLELSGVPQSLVQMASEEDWQGRAARIWQAVLDDAGAFVGEPFCVFS